MQPWLQKHIDTHFSDFEGLSISGHIPLKDQVMNELLSEVLRGAQQPQAAQAAGAPDLRPLLKMLKKAELRGVNGALVIDFEIGV